MARADRCERNRGAHWARGVGLEGEVRSGDAGKPRGSGLARVFNLRGGVAGF